MAFRRQDIPKTTRKGEEGEPRKLYPRFAKDRALLPKVELATGYLDGMVGRRRGDLSPDVVIELFGDPKLARCVLACLADSYRYRTPTIAEIVGEETALALAGWELLTPTDLRAHVYRSANSESGGFVAPERRSAFLAEVAGPLGLTGDQVESLLHLDAERNALLIRVGPRPRGEDVVARYNVMLALSVLRHASEVTLELPGLDRSTIETVCSRLEVPARHVGAEAVRLAGRQSSLGGWGQFGARVARCAIHLILLAPRAPSGRALVHLNGQPLAFALDGFVVGALRPPLRAVAGAEGVVRSALLSDGVTALRRKSGGGSNGWTMRRALEPLVVEGAIALPEWLFTRDQDAVAVVPVASPAAGGEGTDRRQALAALERVRTARPVLALGEAAGSAVPAVDGEDAVALIARLEEIVAGRDSGRTPLGLLTDEVLSVGWVSTDRLGDVLGGGDLPDRVRPITVEGETVFVPGVGLCRVSLLDDLLDQLCGDPVDVAALRRAVADRVGVGATADALTLHLLGRHAVLAAPSDEGAAVDRAA